MGEPEILYLTWRSWGIGLGYCWGMPHREFWVHLGPLHLDLCWRTPPEE